MNSAAAAAHEMGGFLHDCRFDSSMYRDDWRAVLTNERTDFYSIGTQNNRLESSQSETQMLLQEPPRNDGLHAETSTPRHSTQFAPLILGPRHTTSRPDTPTRLPEPHRRAVTKPE